MRNGAGEGAASRSAWRAAGLFAVLLGVYILARKTYYVGYFNDDAFYLIGARSLLLGRYANLHLPGQPPMTQYYPGYPALLAPLLFATRGSVAAAQFLTVLLLSGALLLLDRLWKESLPVSTRTAALLLAGLCPLFVTLSSTITAEGAYLFCVALTLVAASRGWDKERLGNWLALGLLAGFGALIRPNGIALPLSLCAALALERRWKPGLMVLLSGMAPMGLFLFRNRTLSGLETTYLLELADPLQTGAGGLARLIVGNILFYFKEIFANALFRWPPSELAQGLSVATALAAVVAAVAGLRRMPLHGWRKLPWLHAAIYTFSLLPWYKQSNRYVLPLLPFAAAAILSGADVLGERFGYRRRGFWTAVGLSAALGAWSLQAVLRTALTESNSVNTPPLRTYGWIAGNTNPRAVFTTEMNGRLYLYTARKAVRPPVARTDADLSDWAAAQGVDYVLTLPGDQGMLSFGGARNGTLTSDLFVSKRFQLVFADSVERSTIYRRR